jgi:hypothetical protein
MAYAGYGGAPVIDADGTVAGLLIDGGDDWIIHGRGPALPGKTYEAQGACVRWNRCERLGELGCPGSLVGSAEVVDELLERSGWKEDAE